LGEKNEFLLVPFYNDLPKQSRIKSADAFRPEAGDGFHNGGKAAAESGHIHAATGIRPFIQFQLAARSNLYRAQIISTLDVETCKIAWYSSRMGLGSSRQAFSSASWALKYSPALKRHIPRKASGCRGAEQLCRVICAVYHGAVSDK
jgi:hypothetical protein